MKGITAVILTKNEAKNIARCITSLQWCDQILVIDDDSQDKTVTIAQKLGAKIIPHQLNQDFAQQRNFALNQVNTEWTLYLDADEQIPLELAHEIQQAITSDYPIAYRLKRQDIFFKKPLRYGETARWNQIRLSKTDAGKWVQPVHELWEIEGTVGQLHSPFLHFSHDDLTEFFNKINQYSTIVAQEFYHQGKRSSWWQIISYPPGKFLQNYLLFLGFLDGTHGFIHAALMSFHSYLVRSKLFLLQRKDQ